MTFEMHFLQGTDCTEGEWPQVLLRVIGPTSNIRIQNDYLAVLCNEKVYFCFPI